MLHWLLQSNAGLALRVTLGVCVLVFLAVTDLQRNKQAATRWREYSVLIASVLVACAYGVVNDQITATISWEYFFYAKELELKLGPTVPPDMVALRWQAVMIGLMATWSAGLIFGVVLLLANNPFRDIPRLRNRQLIGMLPLILAVTIAFAAIFAPIGYYGGLDWITQDFPEMRHSGLFRPARFICAWSIHLGGYLGGLLGTLLAAARVVQLRFRLKRGEI